MQLIIWRKRCSNFIFCRISQTQNWSPQYDFWFSWTPGSSYWCTEIILLKAVRFFVYLLRHPKYRKGDSNDIWKVNSSSNVTRSIFLADFTMIHEFQSWTLNVNFQVLVCTAQRYEHLGVIRTTGSTTLNIFQQ